MEDLHELPAEAYDDDEPVEPPLSGVRAEAVSAIVEDVAAMERSQAKLKAWQVEQIDEARRLAEATEHGVLTVGSTLSANQRREMARRSLVAELACALRMPEATVSGMLAESEALMHRLPATMDALRAGEISYRHARVLVDQTHTLSPDAAAGLEEQALPFAKTLTVSKFTAKARVLREHFDPESITERTVKSAQDRGVEFQPAPDGMAWLSLFTTAPEASSIYTAVRDRAVALRKKPDECRTLAQLTADVCTDALAAALSGDIPRPPRGENVASATGDADTDAGAGADTGSTIGSGFAFSRIRPTVMVTVPALTLLGWGNQPATLEGYGPIDPDTARMLAGQSKTWYRMLTDPKTGAPIAVDTTKYRPTKEMRRYLEYVYGSCSFTGCNRAARHCDLDHTQAHQFGGPTQCDNLAPVCPPHHRLKHETTWQAKQLGGGALEWTSPGGRTYVTQPDVLLAVPEPLAPKALESPRALEPPNPTADPAPEASTPDDIPPF